MKWIERVIQKVTDSRLKVEAGPGWVKVMLGEGRSQTVHIQREDDRYVFTSVVLGATRTEQQRKDLMGFAERVWFRNRQTDVVNFTIDLQNRLVGRIENLADSLDDDELFFYLSRLAIECDRMEYLLTGDNRF